MRRPRNKQLKTVYLRKRTSVKDSEGVVTASYGESEEFRADIASNVGTVQAMSYGEKANYMHTMTVWDDISISEGDGVCVNVPCDSEPDYSVIAIHQFTYFKTVEVERICR